MAVLRDLNSLMHTIEIGDQREGFGMNRLRDKNPKTRVGEGEMG